VGVNVGLSLLAYGVLWLEAVNGIEVALIVWVAVGCIKGIDAEAELHPP